MINIDSQLFLPISSVLRRSILANQETIIFTEQSFSGYLIYVYYKYFDSAEKANTYGVKSRRLRSQKVVIIVEELDCIDIDDIGNIEDLLRVAFIDKTCWNLKVVIDCGELTRNIRRSQTFYRPIDVH